VNSEVDKSYAAMVLTTPERFLPMLLARVSCLLLVMLIGCDTQTNSDSDIEDEIPMSGKLVFTAVYGGYTRIYISDLDNVYQSATRVNTLAYSPRGPKFGESSTEIYYVNEIGQPREAGPTQALRKIDLTTGQDSLLEWLPFVPPARDVIYPLMYAFEVRPELEGIFFSEPVSPDVGFNPQIRKYSTVDATMTVIWSSSKLLFGGFFNSNHFLSWSSNEGVVNFNIMDLEGHTISEIEIDPALEVRTVLSADVSETLNKIAFAFQTEFAGPARVAIFDIESGQSVIVDSSDQIFSDFLPTWGPGNELLFLRETGNPSLLRTGHIFAYNVKTQLIVEVVHPSLVELLPSGIGGFDYRPN